MGNIQVTTTPQSVILGDMGDSIILQNNGPYAVYVDSNSAINSSSHKLPPTGTLAWDPTRELWLVADPAAGNNYSSVSWTPNSAAAAFSNEVDGILYQANQLTAIAAGFSGNISPLVDCSAYQSLKLTVGIAPSFYYAHGDAITGAKSWSVLIQWFDAKQNFIGSDNYNIPFPSSESIFTTVNGLDVGFNATPGINLTPSSRLTTPVKGSYFKLYIETSTSSGNPNALNMQLTVLGMTRTMTPMIAYTGYDAVPHLGAGAAGNSLPYTALSKDGFVSSAWGSNGVGFLAYADICPMLLSKSVRVTVKPLATVTVAGTLRICSAYDNGISLVPDIAIPAVAAGPVYSAQLDVPINHPWMLHWATIPQSAGPVPVAFMTVALTYL